MRVISLFEQSLNLDKSIRHELNNITTIKTFVPRSIIPLEENKQELFFIVRTGLVRSFYEHNDREIGLSLLTENDLFGNPEAKKGIYTRHPVVYETIEHTQLYCIPKHKWQILQAETLVLSHIWNQITEQQQENLQLWNMKFKRIKRDQLLLRLIKHNPRLISKGRIKHLVDILELNSQTSIAI